MCIVFSSENEKNYFNQYNRKYFDPNLQHKWYCPFICSYEDFKKGYIRLYEVYMCILILLDLVSEKRK